MRRLIRALLLLALAASPAWSQPSYYESADVPTDLPFGAGATYGPWRVARNAAGIYLPAVGLPTRTAIDAVFRTGGGRWLISLESTADLGGLTFEPGDVFQWDGGAVFVPFFDASAAGVPDGTNVDAAFLHPVTGDLILSFDVPVRLSGILFQPGDLARFGGGAFNLFFDATLAAIPDQSNLVAADIFLGRLVLALDVPTTAGAVLILPGELWVWDGISLSPFDPQPGWPADRSSTLAGLSFPADPGEVGPTLTVERIGAAQLRLTWNASSCSGGEDYGIYQGMIGSFYSHTPVVCTDAGVPLQEDIPLPAGDTYYLVVPHNDPGLLNPAFSDEGSYGLNFIGGAMNQRPAGAGACVSNQVLACSP